MPGRPSPEVAHRRARCAVLSRDLGPDNPKVLLAQRDLRYEMLAEHVARVVALAPPLDNEQRATLALLLGCGAA